MKAVATSRTKIASPTSAIRWWRKRRKARLSWLRPATPSGPPSVGAPTARSAAYSVAAVPNEAPTSRCGPLVPAALAIADPRVERRVRDVREQVEEDDDGRGDHEPRLHGVHVGRQRAGETAEQELPHALPAVDDLRDHGAADDRREVERDHGRDRDQRVPQRMLDEHAPP